MSQPHGPHVRHVHRLHHHLAKVREAVAKLDSEALRVATEHAAQSTAEPTQPGSTQS